MSKHFATPDAFKQAIEARLRTMAGSRGISVNDLRLRFAMERLLARLFAVPKPPWLLKGGYAMDLRYRPKARTTRDIDLTVGSMTAGALASRLVVVRDEMQAAVEIELGDHLEFRVGQAKGELPGAPQGGGRFPIEVQLGGKVFSRFHLDVGFGDAVIGAPERLTGEDFLAFAGIAPCHALAIPKAQQFAEKVHAYTYPWTDRANTRVKDLVDMVLLIERGELASSEVTNALRVTFAARKGHALPTALLNPPEFWGADFPAMAAQAGLSTENLSCAFGILSDYWNAHTLK